jgi:hypothetical protein
MTDKPQARDDYAPQVAAARAAAETLQARAEQATLRDQFAMAALTGWMAHPAVEVNSNGAPNVTAPSDLARSCYVIANAMLAARTTTQQEG